MPDCIHTTPGSTGAGIAVEKFTAGCNVRTWESRHCPNLPLMESYEYWAGSVSVGSIGRDGRNLILQSSLWEKGDWNISQNLDHCKRMKEDTYTTGFHNVRGSWKTGIGHMLSGRLPTWLETTAKWEHSKKIRFSDSMRRSGAWNLSRCAVLRKCSTVISSDSKATNWLKLAKRKVRPTDGKEGEWMLPNGELVVLLESECIPSGWRRLWAYCAHS